VSSTSTSTATARSAQTDSALAASELVAGLGAADPTCIVFFAAHEHDGAVLGGALKGRFPRARVIGCSSNGEFCDRGYGKGGAVAIALGPDKVRRAAVALVSLADGVEAGVVRAAASLSRELGADLRELSPERYAGLALLEGATGREEEINAALGNVSPIVSFVGGSAGDNITFSTTWVFADGEHGTDACALMVLELLVPHVILKTCNYVETEQTTTVTKVSGRIVLELDGRPAAERYAELIGAAPDKLGFGDFMAHPLGLMIDGEPWLRSGVKVVDGGGLFFACSMLEGTQFHLMKGVDLVEDARAKLAAAAAALGGPPGGAIFFNCAYRMIEAQVRGSEAAYHALLSTLPHVGLHTNGESYIGHINQTLTGLLLG
jgi:hypothetical protein